MKLQYFRRLSLMNDQRSFIIYEILYIKYIYNHLKV